MPANCNGLKLIDETKDFDKWNCKWVKRSTGRPKVEKKVLKKQPRHKFHNPRSICLVMEKDLLDFIKNQALQKSIQEGKMIEPNAMIREALQKAFPVPKQLDMFSLQK